NQPPDGEGQHSRPRSAVQGIKPGRSRRGRGCGRRAGVVAGGRGGGGEAKDFEMPEEVRNLKANLPRFGDKELIPLEGGTTARGKTQPAYLQRVSRPRHEPGNVQTPRPT